MNIIIDYYNTAQYEIDRIKNIDILARVKEILNDNGIFSYDNLIRLYKSDNTSRTDRIQAKADYVFICGTDRNFYSYTDALPKAENQRIDFHISEEHTPLKATTSHDRKVNALYDNYAQGMENIDNIFYIDLTGEQIQVSQFTDLPFYKADRKQYGADVVMWAKATGNPFNITEMILNDEKLDIADYLLEDFTICPNCHQPTYFKPITNACIEWTESGSQYTDDGTDKTKCEHCRTDLLKENAQDIDIYKDIFKQ